MTPDQFSIFLAENEKSTGRAVEKHVNGHIREIRDTLEVHIVKHDAFMEEVKPILEAYRGGKMLGEGLKWIAGIAGAYLVIKGIWR